MNPSILLAEGVRLQQQKAFADAAERYAEVLRLDPVNADALYRLAQLSCQQGHFEAGIDYAGRALAVDPSRAPLHLLLGMALARVGRADEALASFEKAIAISPDLADAHGNRGDVLAELRRHAEAIESYNCALSINPRSFENWCNRAAALMALGRSVEALDSYDRALSIKPDHVDVLVARGALLNTLGRRGEAVESLDRALGRAPDHREALRMRSVTMLDLGRFEEALASLLRVLAQTPEDAATLYNIGFAFAALDRDHEALAAFDKVLAADPGHVEALLGRGAALQNLCRFDEAVEAYERVVAIEPERAEAHYSEAMALLCLGDYRRGLPKYEWRRTLTGAASVVRRFAEPLWLGDAPLAGKTLLLHAEQGIGDALYAARYVPMLAQVGARAVLQVHATLKDLLSGLEGVAAIASKSEPLPPFDCHCPLMSLPLAFKTEAATIPADVPYVQASQARVTHWRGQLPEEGKLRVGVVWCGNPAFKEDHRRSLKLAQIAPLLAVPDVSFYSLNPGIGEADVAALAAWPNVRHLGSQFRDFSDTAAVVSLLDLVITSDTSMAHLAGAMARPVWVMLGYSPDWRWAVDHDRSSWYPTARLFRQAAVGEWASVIDRVRRELVALARHP